MYFVSQRDGLLGSKGMAWGALWKEWPRLALPSSTCAPGSAPKVASEGEGSLTRWGLVAVRRKPSGHGGTWSAAEAAGAVPFPEHFLARELLAQSCWAPNALNALSHNTERPANHAKAIPKTFKVETL